MAITKAKIKKGDAKLIIALDRISKLAQAYQITGNDKVCDELMHIGALVKEAREEYIYV